MARLLFPVPILAVLPLLSHILELSETHLIQGCGGKLAGCESTGWYAIFAAVVDRENTERLRTDLGALLGRGWIMGHLEALCR